LQDPEEIKSHPYFAKIDWESLYQKSQAPPFIPNVKNKESTTMIDKEFTKLDIEKELKKGSLVETDFPDFSFTENGFIYKDTTETSV